MFWEDTVPSTAGFSVYNDRFIYKSHYEYGLRLYDMEDLPSTENVIISEFEPLRHNCFYDGFGYISVPGSFYRVDPESGESTLVCNTPIVSAGRYHPDGDKIFITGYDGANYCVDVVNIVSDELETNFNFNQEFYAVLNGKICASINNTTIGIYRVNDEGEP